MADETERQAGTAHAQTGRGLGLLSLVVGLAAGGGVYLINEHLLRGASPSPAAFAALQSTIVFGASWLLLSERRDFIRPLGPAAILAAVLAAPSFFMISIVQSDNVELDEFPLIFWFFAAAPLSSYLLVMFFKAILETGFPPGYPSLYFHGLTLPLVAGGAALFAGLALILLYAWAALLKQMGVQFFSEVFDEPWFILPFLGAIGGLSIAMIRGQLAVLGALRFMLLLFSRIAMPIMALFSVTFIVAFAVKGATPLIEADVFFGRPAAFVMALAFAGMLIFNGVYQNGEGGPPSAWLRVSTIIAIAVFPLYTGLSAYGLWTRVSEYGLTPSRIGGAAMTVLALAYSLALLAGAATEVNWRARKWMPLVAPLNTIMALVWIAVLIGLSTPVFNPWAISARSQEELLASEKIDAAKFDYGYLQFKLGAYGAAALARMETRNHPQSEVIRREIARAREALTYWEYQNPELSDRAFDQPSPIRDPASSDQNQPGPMELEFNPEDAGSDE